MYDILLFDIDETLFDFKETEVNALRRTMDEMDIDYCDEYLILYKEINSKLWEDLEKGLIKGEDIKVQRFHSLNDALKLNINPNIMSDKFLLNLGHEATLYADSIPLLDYLKNKYTMCIITNGLKVAQDIKIDKIKDYFVDAIISEEVSISKPNPAIFELALSRLDSKDKSRVLMIGDSLSSDIMGGINAGIDTCWFNQYNKRNVTDIKPTYEIRNLMDLRNII